MVVTRRRVGGVFLGVGLLALGAPLWVRALAWTEQQRLQAVAPALPAPVAKPTGPGAPAAAPLTPPPPAGSVVAALQIPALGLQAAVVAGTDPFALATAPGWVNTTALPGQDGTAVIAAHNATFFRHLNHLQPGQTVSVTTRQGRFLFRVEKARVVRAGQPIRNTRRPSLALVACWPLDALYLTPWRYVVTARLVRSQLSPQWLPPASPAWPYQAAVPAAIADHHNLTLAANDLAMGTLDYQAPPTAAVWAFESSALPYDLVAETLRLFFAARYAAAARDVADYRRMTVGPGPLPPFWGQFPTVRGAADVTIVLSPGGRPQAVRLRLSDVSWGTVRNARLAFLVTVAGHTLRIAGVSPQSANPRP
jgi:sortase A